MAEEVIYMIRARLLCFVSVLCFIGPVVSRAREIDPFVSAEWLERNSSAPGLLILDVRSADEYGKGHIPNSLNAGADLWAVNQGKLMRELPDSGKLGALMSSLGIKEGSKVVVVGRGASDFDRADAVRVAWTMIASGIKNVSVLDGGFQFWIKVKKAANAVQAAPAAGEYNAKISKSATVSKNYVLSRIGKATIVDARAPDVYFGVSTEPWAPKAGHIQHAVNLPAPWIFQKDGFLRPREELERMAKAVIGENKSKEVIVYCGVGVYASVWSYILTEMLDYRNAKVYDGSMQEWIMDKEGPLELFGWK
jgi:thiosulfate/3-mercaptopyruvate sulfurtransferase